MQIGQRLREVRDAKKLSHGDLERRTGLLRCYISRVENGPTVPSVETIEKFARAFEIPTYQLFIGKDQQPNRMPHALRAAGRERPFGKTSKEEQYFIKFWRLLSKVSEHDRTLLFAVARGMAKR
ncbi:MAG: helix-turn-helix transcriptional regulator [Candidatus Acidiferrales bacterium]